MKPQLYNLNQQVQKVQILHSAESYRTFSLNEPADQLLISCLCDS